MPPAARPVRANNGNGDQRLLEPSPTLRFRAGTKIDLAQLRQLLDHQSLTAPIPIKSQEDLFLNDRWLVQGRYRYTQMGFSAVCSVLAQSLSSFALHLAGESSRGGHRGQRDAHSRVLAGNIFNSVTRLRFRSVLADQSLIIDPRTNTIEGLVGPRYVHFRNADFLQTVEEFTANLQPAVRFADAICEGRKFYIRYVRERPSFRIRKGLEHHDYYFGYGFGNSELGDLALTGSVELLRSDFGGISWSVLRRIHTKRMTATRMQRALSKLAEPDVAPDVNEVKEQLENLLTQSLGFSQDPEEVAKRLKSVESRLRLALPPRPQMLREIMRKLISRGSFPADRVPKDANPRVLTQILGSRSYYDAFTAVTWVSTRHRFEDLRRLAKYAQKILQGRAVL